MEEINDIIAIGYKEELEEVYTSLSNRIETNTLNEISAKCYFKHLPIKEKHPGWDDKIYDISNRCHKILYDYCKEKQYIKQTDSYEDYLKGSLFVK